MSFKQECLEVFWIVKMTLTTFWFWLPILFAIFGMFEIWMFFSINPLTIFIFPTIVSIYALRLDNKRRRASLREIGNDKADTVRPIGSGPEFAADWDAQEKVEEYLKTVKKDDDEP